MRIYRGIRKRKFKRSGQRSGRILARRAKNTDYSEYARRNENLTELGFKDYKQYLRSKLWKTIRGRKLEQDPLCYGCGRKANQVHHGKYGKEILAGNVADSLFAVCGRCHKWAEFTRTGYKRSPEQATIELFQIRKMRLMKAGWT